MGQNNPTQQKEYISNTNTQLLAAIFMGRTFTFLIILTLGCCSTKRDGETTDKTSDATADSSNNLGVDDISERALVKPGQAKEWKSKPLYLDSARTRNFLSWNGTITNFSDTLYQDTLLVYVTGNSLRTGEMHFQIINWEGRLIYNETFPSFDPMELDESPTEKGIEDHVRKSIDTFFKPDAFIFPAIDPEEFFDEDYIEKEIWDEIKANGSAIRFVYSAGYEATYSIAYSKRLKKAVVIFVCC